MCAFSAGVDCHCWDRQPATNLTVSNQHTVVEHLELAWNYWKIWFVQLPCGVILTLARLYIYRLTFLVAEACLIAGATKNAYHTKYRGMIYAQNFSCESLRKGVFVAGAVFVVATMILNVYYYMYFTKATTSQAAHKTSRPSSTVGMTGYA